MVKCYFGRFLISFAHDFFLSVFFFFEVVVGAKRICCELYLRTRLNAKDRSSYISSFSCSTVNSFTWLVFGCKPFIVMPQYSLKE